MTLSGVCGGRASDGKDYQATFIATSLTDLPTQTPRRRPRRAGVARCAEVGGERATAAEKNLGL